MQARRGFTVRDLFVVIFVVAVLLGLLLPALQHSSDRGSRRANCVSNLKHIGIGLQNYHDVFKTFPPGGVRRGDDPTQTVVGAHALIIAYIDETTIKFYNERIDWFHHHSGIASTVIPVFACPSNGGDDPFEDKLLNELVLVPGSGGAFKQDQRLGVTTYAFCKGVTDAWCYGANLGPPGPPDVPVSERGMFDMNWSMSIRQITDGTSRTIAAGEASGGPAWPLTATTSAEPNRWRNAPTDKFGMPRHAQQAWIAMQPSTAALSSQGLYVSSTMACTLEWMNKIPVTDSWADVTALDDCRKSLPSAPGTKGPTTKGGPHVTPNFRSDHPGGCNFLFADGSVHFLMEDIDMLLYQRLSTAMEGEKAEIPYD